MNNPCPAQIALALVKVQVKDNMAYININTDAGKVGLVTALLYVDSDPMTFIIDTGSNVSHIDKSVGLTLSGASQLMDEGCVSQGLGGALSTFGKIKQKLHTGIFTFDQVFLITDLSEMREAVKDAGGVDFRGILGTDFLTKYRCHLDFKKSRLHLG